MLGSIQKKRKTKSTNLNKRTQKSTNMFNFLKPGLVFNKLAESMNGLNLMIQNLIPKIERSNNYSEFEEDILTLTYIARKGVLDRIEQYSWSMEKKIFVPTIDKQRITLMYAYTQTVGKLQKIANNLNFTELYDEIMEKGVAFYQIENNLPKEIIKNI